MTTTSRYAEAIGAGRAEVATPALLLDIEILQANINAMATWARGRVDVRPHAKIHKCVEIAKLQVEAGARGITVATIFEALALAQAEAPAILIANEIVDPLKLDLLAEAARARPHIIAVDSEEGVRALSAAAIRAGSEIGVLVDVDVGMGRCGMRTAEDALRVAALVDGSAGLELQGVMGYEGHVVTEPDRAARTAKAVEAMDLLAQRVGELEAAGFPIGIVSAGGTNTFDMTGLHPRVTELQTGSYAVMDEWYSALTPTFRPALKLLARCISRQADTAVLDCGTKAITVEYMQPRLPAGCGRIREVHEEHMLLDVSTSDGPGIGETVEIGIGYCGGTINLHDAYYVTQGDTVVDVWSIRARGPGRGAR